MVEFRDVAAASGRMRGKVVRTPLLESVALNNMTGARILVKAECLQLGGSFKVRGALNRVLRLPMEQRNKGVIAFSSGNFGQGLALACRMTGVQCTIVMPGDAPANKQARARSYGSTVVLSEVIAGINREVTAAELAEKLAAEHEYTLLHPFEDFDVIAGQGTCGLEIAEQCREKSLDAVDVLLIPTGGGGLCAGSSLAMAHEMPDTAVMIVEPEGYDDHVLSLNKPGRDERIVLGGTPATLCDSLQAVAPGANTWPINRQLVRGGISVTDAEVRVAMRVAFEALQIVLEPGGATGLAAVLANKIPGGVVGKTIALVASGGNLTFDKFAKCLGCEVPADANHPVAFDWTGLEAQHVLPGPSMSKHLLVVRGKFGYLACGYVDVGMADKLGEVCAIVSGVSKPEDMLPAKLVKVSKKAEEIGLRVGMLGAAALAIMRNGPPASKL